MPKEDSRRKVRTSGKENQARPPIVCILGHVDHGKTTLLDFIRKTSVAKREAGGITQGIGASVIKTKEGKSITFIDTPGHAAFSKMRSRGAKVADLAILVVAANDGVKPQTEEALDFIREADIPFVVAATKVDLESANTSIVRTQLKNLGVKFEGAGGDVPLVEVSGKTGKGVDDLLEMISLVSELKGLEGKEEDMLDSVVIETDKDNRGVLVSVVLRSGTLGVGDEIVTEGVSTKVRGLFDQSGKPIRRVLPGEPALVLGFSKLPPIGSVIKYNFFSKGEEASVEKKGKGSISEGQIPIVIKSSSAGSLEAILENLPTQAYIVHSEVGDVNENDVFLAKTSGFAVIFAFEAKATKAVENLAKTEGVEIFYFDVIYELFDKFNEFLKKGQDEVLGKAQIIADFPFNRQKVAGCKVIEGKVRKDGKLYLYRGKEKLGKIKALSMKKEKRDILEAKAGEEFGMIFVPKFDFKKGDAIIAIR